MTDEEIIANKIARYMAEAGGDTGLAMRLMAIDLHRMGFLISTGLVGAPPVRRVGFPTKNRIEPLDIPDQNSPEASTPV